MNGRMSQIEKEQYDQFQCSGSVDVLNMLYKTAGMPDTKVSAMNLTFSPQFVQLGKFDGMIGKNDLHADGRIENFMPYLFKDSALLTGTFNMRSAMMNLNEFSGDESAPATQPAAEESSSMSVIEVPANIDFTLTTSITKMIYDNINMDNVTGAVVMRNRAIDLDQLKMNLMGGTMVMDGSYSTVNPVIPKVDFKMDIADFDIQQTFASFNTVQKLVPIGKNSKGKFSTNMSYTSDLDQAMMPVLTTVNGSGVLRTKQVEVDGFEPLKKLDEALKLNKFKKVTFNDIALTFKIENGRVSTDPFDFNVGKVKGKIGGSTGIDQSIKYVAEMSIPRTEFGAANTALNSMVSSANAKGVPVQLGDMVNVSAIFGGTVTNPTVSTNLKEAGGNMLDNLKDQVVGTVTQKIDSLKDVGKGKACDEARQILADAQKKADEARTAGYSAADQAQKAADAEADKVEKSFKNPLEKAAKKAAADAMRKKSADANKSAKAAADKKAADIMADAQKRADEKCPK
jgi:hypothetical protein